MIIRYDKNLEKQEFWEDGRVLDKFLSHGLLAHPGTFFVHGIANPLVALDGHALSGSDFGRLAYTLFNNSSIPNISTYDGLINQWIRLPGTWPTTIDTVIHLRGQSESKALDNAVSVLDMGCGNGQAGVYAALKHPHIERVDFSDVEPNAVKTAHRNRFIAEIYSGLVVQGTPLVGDAFEAVDGKYDVILASAVPATPVVPNLGRSVNPLFEGTGVLEKILRGAAHHLNPGGKLIISHSSVGDKAFSEVADEVGARVDRLLYSREAGFKTEFLGSDAWTEYLVKSHGLVVRDGENLPYRHEVRVKEVSYQ